MTDNPAKAPGPTRCEMCGDSGKIPILDPATQKVTGDLDCPFCVVRPAVPAQEARPESLRSLSHGREEGGIILDSLMVQRGILEARLRQNPESMAADSIETIDSLQRREAELWSTMPAQPVSAPSPEIPDRVPSRWKWLYHGYKGSPVWHLHLQQILRELGTTESTLAAEREARKQAEEALRKLERLMVELYPGHAEPDAEHLGEHQAVWNAVRDARDVLSKPVQEPAERLEGPKP
jgi:hypothetical protein